MPESIIHHHDKIKLLRSGDEYFNKIKEVIRNAKYEIHLQFYIFNNDATGKKFADELILAANRGVKVYMLLDSYGSSSLNTTNIEALKASGIRLRKFSTPTKYLNLHFGKRLHHKVIVVDNNEAIIGGINIANRYSGYDKFQPWLDYAVYITGKPCWKTHRLCRKLFFKTKKISLEKIRKKFFRLPDLYLKYKVAVLYNDWFRGRFEISLTYRRALRHAQKDIIILASYFVPGIRISHLLKQASNRGVKISLVLPGRPDVAIFRRSQRYLYRWMLRNKISIYEYQPTMMHAKAAVIDDYLSIIGSFNLISLSEYGSTEMNVAIYDQNFTTRVRNEFESIIKNDCINITDELLKNQGALSKLLDKISFHVVRFMMRLYIYSV